jgi:hypothetical protein
MRAFSASSLQALVGQFVRAADTDFAEIAAPYPPGPSARDGYQAGSPVPPEMA